MPEVYEKCLDILRATGLTVNYDYYKEGDSLSVSLNKGSSSKINLVIQNSDIPEVDIEIDELKWYLSLTSEEELTKKMAELKEDILYLNNNGVALEAKKLLLINNWCLIDPVGLKVLKTTRVGKFLPGRVKVISFVL